MMRALHRALEALRYGTGQAQFIFYGMWTVVASGLFAFDGAWQLLSTAWKLIGAVLFVSAIWGNLRHRRALLLMSTMSAIFVGSVYTSKAVVFEDVDIVRATTQSHYMVLAVLVVWGFYLANLCSRQILEFAKMGVRDE